MIKKQNYISSELTHFVGRSLQSDEERYALFIKIIKLGLLRGRVDNGKGSTMVQVDPNLDFSGNEAYNVNMVCFCDIPTADFYIHMQKYSRFGIGFTKEFLIKQGVRPVCYVPNNAVVINQNISEMFNKNIKELNRLKFNAMMKFVSEISLNKNGNEITTYNPMEIDQFIDLQLLSFIKFFDPTKEDDDIDNYYMEREWRGLERVEFSIKDIYRIIVPSSYIRKFFDDIKEYNGHITTV